MKRQLDPAIPLYGFILSCLLASLVYYSPNQHLDQIGCWIANNKIECGVCMKETKTDCAMRTDSGFIMHIKPSAISWNK